MIDLRIWFLALGVVAAWGLPDKDAQGQSRPNIIFILADDVGIGDLGPYGQETILTPALDQLASDGTRFTQMYSGAPVCSPSRAILMTGLHNGRHVNGNGVNLQAGNVTVAEVLKTAGYATGGFGKWHLGSSVPSLPTNQGFDQYFGILGGVAAWDHFAPEMQRLTSADPNTIVNVSNNGGFTDDLVGAEAVQFISAKAPTGQPFYAQVNFQLAHFDMEVPELESYTVDQPWPESRTIFASMITRLDRLVGNIVAAVDDPNGDGDNTDSVANNTLIVFASDNGTHIEPQSCCTGNHGPNLGVFSDDPHDPEFFDSNGIYRGWKRDLYDGGIKTPFLARWTGTVAAGSTNETLFGDFADFLPTVAELAGTVAPVGIDGVSYASQLTGTGDPADMAKEFQYFEGGGSIGGVPAVPARRGLIRDGYKAIEFTDGHIELYHLLSDPSESNDLYATQTQLAQQMIATAVSQDGGQIAYRTLVSGAYFHQSGGWLEGSVPGANSIATIAGNGATESEFYADDSISLLGLDIGSVGPARLTLLPGQEAHVANGVRVESNSELRLEASSVRTSRRVELAGGKLSGRGTVVGQLLNAGFIAPDGRSVAPPAPPASPNPVVSFDFLGIQDEAPLTATTSLHPYVTLAAGLDFGPGTLARSDGPDGFTGSDAGNEFNVGGLDSTSLASAVAASDYISFSVAPVAGFELLLDSVSFDLWRNGGNAANDYAIMASIDGFEDGNEWAQLNNVISSGPGALQTFTGTYTGGQLVTDPVKLRLYGWNANDGLASTHITGVRLNGTFVRTGTDDALDFNFSGVQDDSPLTRTLLQDPHLRLTRGFGYGPGSHPRSIDGNTSTDRGDEFNAGGFDALSLDAAIVAGDYLAFTVEPVEGFEMSLVSVSYDLWRNGANAANDYAILTSLDGFGSGSELSQLNNVQASGLASKQTYTAFYTGGLAVTDAVEVRLYAWNANDSLASTHITAVSMDATFTLADGSSATFADGTGSETGILTLDGNYVQRASGVLEMQIGGPTPGAGHDQLAVSGVASLDGLLSLKLVGDYVPAMGDSFDLVVAQVRASTFAAQSLPGLPGGRKFDIVYTDTSASAVVGGLLGDFNYDGVVDLADYTIWRDSLGQTGVGLAADGDADGVIGVTDYTVWRTNYGNTLTLVAGQAGTHVPEPSTVVALATGCILCVGAWRTTQVG